MRHADQEGRFTRRAFHRARDSQNRRRSRFDEYRTRLKAPPRFNVLVESGEHNDILLSKVSGTSLSGKRKQVHSMQLKSRSNLSFSLDITASFSFQSCT